MINPYVLQLLAMRQRMTAGASAPMGYPETDIYGMQPWNPVSPVGMPDGMAPGGGPAPVVGAPQPEAPVFDEAGARKRAQREGLGALGLALLAGAGKGDYAGSLAEGLAAMGTTSRQRYQDEQNQFRQATQERLARDSYERQDRLTQAQITNYEADNERARKASEAQSAGLQAEIAKQEAFVATLPPELRARLTPLIGTKELYPTYVEATKPVPPPKPEEPVHIGNQLVEKDAAGHYRPVYTGPSEPSTRMSTEDAAARAAAIAEAVETVRERHGKGAPTQEQMHDDIAAETERLYSSWLKQRMEGVGKVVSMDKQIELHNKGFKGIPYKKAPSEMFVRLPDGSRITEDEFMRRRFRAEAEQVVKRTHRAAGRQRSDMILHFDEEGNPIP